MSLDLAKYAHARKMNNKKHFSYGVDPYKCVICSDYGCDRQTVVYSLESIYFNRVFIIKVTRW